MFSTPATSLGSFPDEGGMEILFEICLLLVHEDKVFSGDVPGVSALWDAHYERGRSIRQQYNFSMLKFPFLSNLQITESQNH